METYLFDEKTSAQKVAEITRVLLANADNEEVVRALMSEDKTVFTNEARSAKNAIIVAVRVLNEDKNTVSTYYFSKAGRLEARRSKEEKREGDIRTTTIKEYYAAKCTGQHDYNKKKTYVFDEAVERVEEISVTKQKENKEAKYRWNAWETVSSSTSKYFLDAGGRFHNTKGAAVSIDGEKEYLVHGKTMACFDAALTNVIRATAAKISLEGFNIDEMEQEAITELAQPIAAQEVDALLAEGEQYALGKALTSYGSTSIYKINDTMVSRISYNVGRREFRRELAAWVEVAKLQTQYENKLAA